MSEIEFNTDDCEIMTDQTFDDWEKEFKKENPIRYWFRENCSDISFADISLYQLIFYPIDSIQDFGREFRWAYQRVKYGWDERVSFSVDYWLNPIMIKELAALKKNMQGVPGSFCKYDESGEVLSLEEAKILWDAELDKMILGFSSAQKIDDLDYDWKDKEIEKQLKDNFEIGMNSFKENYFSLWN